MSKPKAILLRATTYHHVWRCRRHARELLEYLHLARTDGRRGTADPAEHEEQAIVVDQPASSEHVASVQFEVLVFIAHGAPWTEDLLPEAKRSLYPQNMFGRVYWLEAIDLASPQVDTLVRQLVAHHVVIDPTLIATHTKFFGNDPRWLENPDNKRLPEELITGWRSGSFTRDWTAGQYAEAQRAWPKMLGFTKLLHDRGVRLVVGTDAPTAWVIPGSSFHDELALLRDAGIPTDALIRMATHDAARALGREKEFGSVQVGRRADLVLLTANPLERIENTRSIKSVIQGGRLVRSN